MNTWEVEGLQKISLQQPELIREALGQLWKLQPELYRNVVFQAYQDEKISLGKASELLNVTRFELEKDLEKYGIPIHHLSKEDVLDEIEEIRRWKE